MYKTFRYLVGFGLILVTAAFAALSCFLVYWTVTASLAALLLTGVAGCATCAVAVGTSDYLRVLDREFRSSV